MSVDPKSSFEIFELPAQNFVVVRVWYFRFAFLSLRSDISDQVTFLVWVIIMSLMHAGCFLSVIDYASPVFLNCISHMNHKLIVTCKRVFRIIHEYDVWEYLSCSVQAICWMLRDLGRCYLWNFLNLCLFTQHVLQSFLPSLSSRISLLI